MEIGMIEVGRRRVAAAEQESNRNRRATRAAVASGADWTLLAGMPGYQLVKRSWNVPSRFEFEAAAARAAPRFPLLPSSCAYGAISPRSTTSGTERRKSFVVSNASWFGKSSVIHAVQPSPLHLTKMSVDICRSIIASQSNGLSSGLTTCSIGKSPWTFTLPNSGSPRWSITHCRNSLSWSALTW